MPGQDNHNTISAVLDAIQGWLDMYVNQRWHSPLWFVLLALAGLATTAGVAYGIRLALNIGQ